MSNSENENIFESDFFVSETHQPETDETENWQILIVDDEEEVHNVTRYSLRNFEYNEKGVDLSSAYSAKEAKELLSTKNDFCMIFLDVVMESDEAGLELARWIRNDLKNKNTRIILRTGQAGQAPERQVVIDYDINDYKYKTELTADKLFTVAMTAIRTYEHILTLERSRVLVEKVIASTQSIMAKNEFEEFAKSSLEQLVSLLKLDSPMRDQVESTALELGEHGPAAIGNPALLSHLSSPISDSSLPFSDMLSQAVSEKHSIYHEKELLLYCPCKFHPSVFYIKSPQKIGNEEICSIEMFSHSVQMGLEHIDRNEEVKRL